VSAVPAQAVTAALARLIGIHLHGEQVLELVAGRATRRKDVSGGVAVCLSRQGLLAEKEPNADEWMGSSGLCASRDWRKDASGMGE